MNNLVIAELLPTGKYSAIDIKELCRMLDEKDERKVRRQIAKERKNGAIICSTFESSGGYYLPADVYELKEYTRTMEKSARSIFKSIAPARAKLKELQKNSQ